MTSSRIARPEEMEMPMEPRDPASRRSFWSKRQSPLQVIAIVGSVLAGVAILIPLLLVAAIFVGCSVNSDCLG